MIQGSLEWHEWRSKGIGASDVPIILGISKFAKPFDLFLEKTGRVERALRTNPAIERGHELEPVARRKFAAMYNIENDTDETFDPKNLESKTHSFMRASVDGISHDGKMIIEIKYQGKDNHEKALHREIQGSHLAQVQAQLFVSGAERAYLVSIGDDQSVHPVLVLPDENIINSIVAACNEFWNYVTLGAWPSESVAPAVSDLFSEWAKVKESLKILEVRKKFLEEKIFESGVGACGEIRVKTITRVGAVDYAKVPQLQGVDLDPFRKASSIYKQISTP